MTSYSSIADTAINMLSAGHSKKEILNHVAAEASRLFTDGSVMSILLLDKHGLLRNGGSPGLPADYLAAIDGIKPDPRVGTCAAAAATGKVVMTPNFRADDKWAELKHLPLSIGYAGAWTMPIKDASGQVLGTLGTYFKKIRKPTTEEVEGCQMLVHAIAQVLAGEPVHH